MAKDMFGREFITEEYADMREGYSTRYIFKDPKGKRTKKIDSFMHDLQYFLLEHQKELNCFGEIVITAPEEK